MKTTPQSELHDYVADISKHTHVRAGFPLPLGIQERRDEVNFVIFSRYVAAFDWSCSTIPKTHHPHGQSIWTR